jgi:hypothetical protein
MLLSRPSPWPWHGQLQTHWQPVVGSGHELPELLDGGDADELEDDELEDDELEDDELGELLEGDDTSEEELGPLVEE